MMYATSHGIALTKLRLQHFVMTAFPQILTLIFQLRQLTHSDNTLQPTVDVNLMFTTLRFSLLCHNPVAAGRINERGSGEVRGDGPLRVPQGVVG
jgi:hypothetical protein